jgi:hypothetical protein
VKLRIALILAVLAWCVLAHRGLIWAASISNSNSGGTSAPIMAVLCGFMLGLLALFLIAATRWRGAR